MTRKREVVVLVLVGVLVAGGVGAGLFLRHVSRHMAIPGCGTNLKALAIAFQLYASDHNGAFPPLAPEPGRLVPDLSGWDEWPLEPDLFVCPMDPDAPHGAPASAGASASDESYFYLGYALPDAAAGRAFLLALQEHAARGEPMRGPVTEGTGADTVTLLPLSVATGGDPVAATIPVMVERTENHQRERPGINVLYLDGHVRFVELGSGFPAEEWFIDGITVVADG